MKFDYLRQKKELIPLMLFGASVLMALLILIKVVGFFVFSARAENLVERAIAQNDTDTKNTEKYFAESKALADGLKKHNLFAPPPPKQHPVKEVWGILGDEVLIEGRWYKVGDTIGDTKILAIGPTSAKIDWNGAEKVFLPFDATISEAPKRSQSGKAVIKAGKANMVVIQSGRESVSDREGKGKGVKQRGEKQKGDTNWARKMSMDELRGVRGQIAEYIEGLRAKGVTDPEKYEGALKKMEAVESAMDERGDSK
ncbi:MAG: hypothetical protein ACYTBX_10840 [Planctomycetota bacterium]|jgi:hypothetical protein